MEYYGKRKCRILKEIRAEIAKRNDIEWVVEDCKHKGNCKGTCPKCEAEVVKLEKELARRQALGKAVAVVGVSAAMTLSLAACDDPFSGPTGGEPDEYPMGDYAIEDVQGGKPLDTEETGDSGIPAEGEVPAPEQTDAAEAGTDAAEDNPLMGVLPIPEE